MMKHAGTAALETLDNLLVQLRHHAVLTERKPGIFYLNSQAFLHFHEDSTELFADLKVNGEWQRFNVTGDGQRAIFLSQVEQAIKPKQ